MHGKKITSYDIWDTVIRRHCHPDAVKIHVARGLLHRLGKSIKPHLRDPWLLFYLRQSTERLIGQEANANGLDDEYLCSDVFARWLERVTVDGYVISPELIEELVRTELDQEKYVLYQDPTIEKQIRSDGADRRIFISDFYMGKSHLIELLEHVGAAEFFDDGYVSCDIGLNKRSGRLFQHVVNSEGVDAASIFHFGDNLHSDVNIPRSHGIHAAHFLPADEHGRRVHKEERFGQRKSALQSLVGHSTIAGSNQVLNFARETAGLFIGFVLYIQEQVISQKLDNLFFFTREGEFFLKLYRILREASPYRDRLPEGVILEVSRVATFGPSLASLTESELMRIWNLYSVQSPRALLKSLDLPEEEFVPLFAEHGLSMDLLVKYPWQDRRVNALFKNRVFLDMASSRLEARKELFIEYCRQKGLSEQIGRCAIVDIGWRGTIQDNIACMLPNIGFTGFYLGLSKVLNSQPPNTSKHSFGPNLNIEDSQDARALLEFVTPIEMLTNSPHGSVVGYERTGANVVARKLVDSGENAVYENFTGAYQEHVLDIASHCAEALAVDAIGAEEIRLPAMDIWKNIIHQPNVALAQAYFSLMHNETFGVGKFVTKSDGLDRLWPLKLLLLSDYRPKFRRQLSEIGWTAGYAKIRKDRLLLPVMKRYYRK